MKKSYIFKYQIVKGEACDIRVIAENCYPTEYGKALIENLAIELEHSTDGTFHYDSVRADSVSDAITIAEYRHGIRK